MLVRFVCSKTMKQIACIVSETSNGTGKIFKITVTTSRSIVKKVKMTVQYIGPISDW